MASPRVTSAAWSDDRASIGDKIGLSARVVDVPDAGVDVELAISEFSGRGRKGGFIDSPVRTLKVSAKDDGEVSTKWTVEAYPEAGVRAGLPEFRFRAKIAGSRATGVSSKLLRVGSLTAVEWNAPAHKPQPAGDATVQYAMCPGERIGLGITAEGLNKFTCRFVVRGRTARNRAYADITTLTARVSGGAASTTWTPGDAVAGHEVVFDAELEINGIIYRPRANRSKILRVLGEVAPGTGGSYQRNLYTVYQGMVRVNGSKAWRNHNPGNLISGDLARSFGSIGRAHGFAVFPDYASGRRAMVGLLQTPRYQALTILGCMQIYAPASDNNNPTRYAQEIATATGLTVDTLLSQMTAAQLEVMANTIERVEGWIVGDEYTRAAATAPAWIVSLLGCE